MISPSIINVMHPSFSIITVVRNDPRVAEALTSILEQDYPGFVELIVIDGASTDGTPLALEPLRPRLRHLVSEPDQGIYDAMNKGLKLATGDLVGLLNAGDFYQHGEVLRRVAEKFQDPDVQACYGDLAIVRANKPSHVLRYWQSGPPRPDAIQWGWMPPHPTFFVRRQVYEHLGVFDTRYRIAGDFEFMLRALLKHRIRVAYIPEVLVKMRAGGASNNGLRNILQANLECRNAFKKHGLPFSPLFIPLKLFKHGLQLLSSLQFYKQI